MLKKYSDFYHLNNHINLFLQLAHFVLDIKDINIQKAHGLLLGHGSISTAYIF